MSLNYLQLEHEAVDNVVAALSAAIAAKDLLTGMHCQRLSLLAASFGAYIGLDAMEIRTLRRAAMLHDIGKLGVPDWLLQKPTHLNGEEFGHIKRHVSHGEDILKFLNAIAGVRPAVRHHHERFDGTGYPDGLSGEFIPHQARILAILDAFDSMTSDRPYRPAMPVSEALAIIERNSGPQWDPILSTLFVQYIRTLQGGDE